jgi:hypothetical protein
VTANRRTFFRLEYPLGERPSLLLDGVAHPVVDLSERGVRFVLAEASLEVGAEVFGTIRFRDGSECRVTGKVARVRGDHPHCALRLDGGVPLPKILAEQRYLIQKYRT